MLLPMASVDIRLYTLFLGVVQMYWVFSFFPFALQDQIPDFIIDAFKRIL